MGSDTLLMASPVLPFDLGSGSAGSGGGSGGGFTACVVGGGRGSPPVSELMSLNFADLSPTAPPSLSSKLVPEESESCGVGVSPEVRGGQGAHLMAQLDLDQPLQIGLAQVQQEGGELKQVAVAEGLRGRQARAKVSEAAARPEGRGQGRVQGHVKAEAKQWVPWWAQAAAWLALLLLLLLGMQWPLLGR